MMRQIGIPLFRVKSKEFQSSLSAVRTMCHPVRMPICLLIHPSGRRVIPSGIRQTSIICPVDVFSPSGHLHCFEKLLCKLAPSGHFSSTSRGLSVLKRCTDSSQILRKGRSINRPDDVVSRPDAYLCKSRITVQNEQSGHLTAVVQTLVHRIW
jgi:hypothetical protein